MAKINTTSKSKAAFKAKAFTSVIIEWAGVGSHEQETKAKPNKPKTRRGRWRGSEASAAFMAMFEDLKGDSRYLKK